jgi:hypothetical protein
VPKPDAIFDLVGEGAALDAEIKAKAKRLAEIKAALGLLAPGEYVGRNDTRAKVIAPAASLKVDDDQLDSIRAVAGETFGKLFERVTSFRPVKSFRDVAAALLPKPKAAKLVALCEVPAAVQVRFS